MFGLFFIVMGIGFLLLSFTWADWLDEHSVCEHGNCSDTGADTTFTILGIAFIAGGMVSSVATELAYRKTRAIVQHVSTFQTSGSLDTAEGVSEFLKPFGIDIQPGANVNVEHRTIDLRSQRSGDVPADPEGLSSYLRARGISIDEEVLRNATVVKDGEVVMPGRPSMGSEQAATPAVTDARAADGMRRETARIIGKRDRGSTTGNQRLIEFDLEVQPAGKAPYRAQVASLVRESLAGLLIEGATLNIRVDPADPHAVSVDWSEN